MICGEREGIGRKDIGGKDIGGKDIGIGEYP
jgi:hypothetical protein